MKRGDLRSRIDPKPPHSPFFLSYLSSH